MTLEKIYVVKALVPGKHKVLTSNQCERKPWQKRAARNEMKQKPEWSTSLENQPSRKYTRG